MDRHIKAMCPVLLVLCEYSLMITTLSTDRRVCLVRAVGAAGSTVFYSAALGGYYHVYSAFGSNAVQMQSAPAPEGPWSSAFLFMPASLAR